LRQPQRISISTVSANTALQDSQHIDGMTV
jgi:hypothetical protein